MTAKRGPTKPKSKSHPWRTWTPDAVAQKYVPKVKIPYQDRMGLK